jgi:Zn-dependent alcohol dehydrogenase
MNQPIPSFIPIRAAVLRAPGAPLKLERLQMEGPREDELLVRIVASGICHTDIDFCEGGGPGPIVLGHEGSGVVERVGRQVNGFRPGDHVVLSYQSCGQCRPCRHGHPAGCERFWEANFGFARLDGTHALQGGVRGHFFGQSSFATHTLGATHSINNRRGSLGSSIAAITDGGVDYVVESTADSAMERLAVELLNPGGKASLLSGATAPGRLPDGREVLSVIQGDAVPQKFIPRLIRLFRVGRFPFDRVVRFYDFAEINRAIADSQRGQAIKPVLLIGQQ